MAKRVRFTEPLFGSAQIEAQMPPEDAENLEEYRRSVKRAADRERRAAEQAEADAEEAAWEAEQQRKEAEKEAAREARRLAEEEEDRRWNEEQRIRREAKEANALVNYNTLVRSLLPNMMETDFEYLPIEQRHTLAALMKRTTAYLEADLQDKPYKVLEKLQWKWSRDDDDE